MREIMYVIDHRLAGRQDWRRPDLSTGRVEATDDQAAAKELFDRADLAGSWAAQGGRTAGRAGPGGDHLARAPSRAGQPMTAARATDAPWFRANG